MPPQARALRETSWKPPILSPHHFRRHARFYLSVLFGAVVGLVLSGTDDLSVSMAVAGTAFFVAYLGSTAFAANRFTVDALRVHASVEDEGIGVIMLITLIAIVLSLGSLGVILGDGKPNVWHLGLAIANVPLSWATLHTVMAFHYAHLFYSPPGGSDATRREAGGLIFPDTDEPSISDFVYYAFVIGMTAQVSDVQATSRRMRNPTLAHGVVSFFFNTVIIALAVSVVAGG